MKNKSLVLLFLLTLSVACKKNKPAPQEENKPEPEVPVIPDPPVSTATDPPLTWQEHWFEHNQLLNRKFFNSSVAIYHDKDVSPAITWPNTYLAQAWNYTKEKYGQFGSDTRLYAIFHTGKYSGGHPSTYFDQGHDYRNVIDCGSSSFNAWTYGLGNDLDLTTHEIGHIVEGASRGIKGSPAFGIWHDSKWMEIYIYDVYLGLNRTADAQRWFNLMINTSDSYPRANTHWFRDWFYPIYAQLGKPEDLSRFFLYLSRRFPTRTTNNGKEQILEYTRGMNYGEFIHFWSGTTGIDLKPLALSAFGKLDEQGKDWTQQLEKAKKDFPLITYLNDITQNATLSVSPEFTGNPNSTEAPGKLVDGYYNTKYFVGGYSPGFSMQLSFQTAVTVTEYTLTSGDDLPDRDPKSWKLSGSNDGLNFIDLDIRSNQIFSERRQTKRYALTNNTAYKHYKLTVTANNGSVDLQMSEFRLLEKPPFSAEAGI